MNRLLPLPAAIAAALLFSNASVSAAPSVAVAKLALLGGQARVLSLVAPLTRVAIANPHVLDVRVLGSQQLLVQALAPGVSSLWLWTKDGHAHAYEVTVGLDSARVQREVRRLTGNAKLSVGDNGRSLLLAGEADTVAQHDAAVKVAGAFGLPVVDATEMATHRAQIAVEVYVLELAKTASLNLGLTFGGGQVSADSGGIRQYVFNPGQVMTGEATTGVVSSWNALDFLATRVDALQNRGDAKLLAKPTLVTTDGGTAKFLAGGEIPIPVPEALGQTTITWKEFGVKLEVTPTLTSDGRIALTVKPEVSSLDFANGVKQQNYTIPAIKTRRAETQVQLAPGQTLMLGGLLNSEHDHAYQLVPGLGDIPVLGELFRSRAFQENQSELAILVTPRLIAPTPALAAGRLEGVRTELEVRP